MEASALPVPQGLTRARLAIGAPLLRLRSDEQLVALFRSGNNEAFRVIHDRYRQRLFAYTRQMLPGSRQDAEDALQDVFVRAFGGLRANHRQLALRAWLYRIAHNRCIDELRRPVPPSPEVMELVRPPGLDPIIEAEQRESLRRLIEDVRRLPDQQRSALLMRELGGMSYNEVSDALGVSVPAVKSLLVRARVSLAQALEARETSCVEIREDLIVAHDRGVRPTGMARRHMRDCAGCREFRVELRGTSKQFAALVPALGPAGVLAKILGLGGGGAAASGGGAAAGGGVAAGGGAAAAGGLFGAGGAVAGVGVIATGAGHVATLLAAAVVAAGGAVGLQHEIAPAHHGSHHRATAKTKPAAPAPAAAVYVSAPTIVAPALSPPPPAEVASSPPPAPAPVAHRHRASQGRGSPLPPKPAPNLGTPYGTGPDGAGPGTTGSDTGAGGSTPGGTPGVVPGTTGGSGGTPDVVPGTTGGSGGTPDVIPGTTGGSGGPGDTPSSGGGSTGGTGGASGSGGTGGTGSTGSSGGGTTPPSGASGTGATGTI